MYFKLNKNITIGKSILLSLLMMVMSSCSKDDFRNEDLSGNISTDKTEINTLRSNYLEKFTSTLSKATYERKDVREFLKKEAIKQFDKNYDVLYEVVKNEKIGNETFRDILISYSSEEDINQIEEYIPLLNILIPEIAIFDIKTEDLNTDDKEIPVAISREKDTGLYINGKKEIDLEKGQVPAFHIIVVNENSRVVASQTRSTSGNRTISFKSPVFDGSITENETKTIKQKTLPTILKLALQEFGRNDSGIRQTAFQRDYIYYGLTPENQKGSLNHSVSEYIDYIRVKPNTYFKIANKTGNGSIGDNPYIKESEVVNKRYTLTEQQQIDKMWTKGAYDFRFELITSTSSTPIVKFVPLKPQEIWNFNIEYERINPTVFRHSKNIYRIDPRKFTSKTVDLSKYNIGFGKWHLSQEALTRHINIFEESEGTQKVYEFNIEFSSLKQTKMNGSAKLGLGIEEGYLDLSWNGYLGMEVTNQNTTKKEHKVTITRSEKSDDLGTQVIFFYDPLVLRTTSSLGIRKFVRKTYNTEYIEFALSTH